MTSFKEDEDLLKLIAELIYIHNKLHPDNNSNIKLFYRPMKEKS
jgi:hypothetical protein